MIQISKSAHFHINLSTIFYNEKLSFLTLEGPKNTTRDSGCSISIQKKNLSTNRCKGHTRKRKGKNNMKFILFSHHNLHLGNLLQFQEKDEIPSHILNEKPKELNSLNITNSPSYRIDHYL